MENEIMGSRNKNKWIEKVYDWNDLLKNDMIEGYHRQSGGIIGTRK
ncbi:MAG: hypothetical protein WDM78_11935 [Puia sp.]